MSTSLENKSTEMDLLIQSVYEENTEKFIAHTHLFNEIYQGSGIIHYVVNANWFEGIELFLKHNGNIHAKTQDYIFNGNIGNMYIIGGRNALFYTTNEEMTQYLVNLGLQMETDNNDNTFHQRNEFEKSSKAFKENYDKVLARVNKTIRANLQTNPNFSQMELIHVSSHVDKRVETFKLPEEYYEIMEHFDDVDYSITRVNSMHYSSYPVNVNNEFIKMVIHYFMNLDYTKDFKISKISGFMIQYDTEHQKELKIHKDDSAYTINICMIEPEAGAELVFTDLDIKIEQKQYEIYFHQGCEMHCVEPLIKGCKKNIVIWIK